MTTACVASSVSNHYFGEWFHNGVTHRSVAAFPSFVPHCLRAGGVPLEPRETRFVHP